ncbi:hypothetical protein P775_14695 [Puniceibacterium antarcticum]|uniref:Transcriptional regulator LacI/GalR-like sensor domain-containing protein n=1 Tax=Puniceibacterium antarcticum TaxID=1206336 RepID=A0A2G8RCW9_9RHOB|nr:substrate-binding domain-containing protein [Puniceibacterium antarcticum]PIL19387.1 hypothetical protein P775_14695 [Puniceibacterium antarcticum]
MLLRHDGFLAGIAQACLAVNPALIARNAVTLQDGADAALFILITPTPPTAIVCAVDLAALGLYRNANRLGLTIGTDLSVFAYDGIPGGIHVVLSLTTFAVDYTVSGCHLSALLIRTVRCEAPNMLRKTVQATYP